MIGDGMGTIYNTAYRNYKQLDRTILDDLYRGRYSTDSLNHTITDSAAGATAFSIGQKTFNGNIGVDVAGNPYGTLLEALKRKGMGTALVATKSVTDATPASFAAHALNRNFQQLIARQMATGNVDFGNGSYSNCTTIDILFGGGRRYFEPWGFNESTFGEYGWNGMVTDNESLHTLCDSDRPAIGLFADDEIPYYLDITNDDGEGTYSAHPSLVDMARVAVEMLNVSYDDKGFFAMIEGSRIDSCGHLNDIACVMAEMEQFYDAVQWVTDWAAADNDTLVVVLADHQTGGLAIGRQEFGCWTFHYFGVLMFRYFVH